MKNEHEPKRITSGIKPLWLLARLTAATLLVGPPTLAVWKLNEIRSEIGTLQQDYGQLKTDYQNLLAEFEGFFDRPYQRPVDLESINLTKNIEPKLSVDGDYRKFEVRHYQFNRTFHELIIRENTQPALEIFHKLANEHLVYGLQVLNRDSNQPFAEYLPETNSLKIEGRLYNLTNPLDFQIAYALTFLKFNMLKEEAQSKRQEESRISVTITGVPDTQDIVHRLNLHKQALEWLKDNNIQLNFTENSVLLVDPTSFANVARTIKLTRNLGFPLPKINVIGPNKEYRGIYYPHHTSYGDLLFDYADEDGSIDSLVHELGHYISQIAARFNRPELSQEAFNQAMEQVEQDHLTSIEDWHDLYYFLRDTDLLRGELQKRDEQYAYIFEHYLLQGWWLKAMIEDTEGSIDPAITAIRQAWYNYFKVALGKEFDSGVLTEEEIASPIP